MYCVCTDADLLTVAQALPIDRSISEVLTKVFSRPACKVLRVVETMAADDESGEPALLASVTVCFRIKMFDAVCVRPGFVLVEHRRTGRVPPVCLRVHDVRVDRALVRCP